MILGNWFDVREGCSVTSFVLVAGLVSLIVTSGPPAPAEASISSAASPVEAGTELGTAQAQFSVAEATLSSDQAHRSGQVTKRVPANLEEVKLSFAPVVKASAPSVVNVYASRRVQQRVAISPLFDDPFFRRFLDQRMLPMPRERVENSLGSGVIVRSEGIIVTNNHVIQGADRLTIALADRREFDAEVILTDEQTDLAVLRIETEGENLPAITFADSDRAEVGDVVLAIGNPFGVGQTVTNGIVSALARTRVGVSDYQFFIQTDAAINPGNSGGALVGLDGHLMGINTAIFSRSGGSNGIGFAIPANMVRLVVDQAVSGGELKRPWFGADGQAVDSALAMSLGLDRPRGLILTAVHPDGPAGKAGLETGDLVLAIDGFEVDDIQALRYRIAIQEPGSVVPVVRSRNGDDKTVRVRLTEPPEVPVADETLLEGPQPLQGATVINLSPATNEVYRRNPMLTGVMVIDVVRRSNARRFGLGFKDIIRTVNGEDITSVDQLVRLLEGGGPSWRIVIEREGRELELKIN